MWEISWSHFWMFAISTLMMFLSGYQTFTFNTPDLSKIVKSKDFRISAGEFLKDNGAAVQYPFFDTWIFMADGSSRYERWEPRIETIKKGAESKDWIHYVRLVRTQEGL